MVLSTCKVFLPFPLLFPVYTSNTLFYSLITVRERESKKDCHRKLQQVTVQSYWSLRKIRFYPKKVYQRGFLDPLRVSAADDSGLTSFKFESKYMALLFLVRRTNPRHSYTSQSWLKSFSAQDWNKDRQDFLWQLRKRFMIRYVYLEVLKKAEVRIALAKAKEKQGSCPKERSL